MLLLSVAPGIVYLYNTKHIETYLPKILYFDSKRYDAGEMKARHYFKTNIDPKVHNDNSRNEKETTRELNNNEIVNENNKDNVLKLKENENNDHIDVNNNQDNEIKKRNNYMIDENIDKTQHLKKINKSYIVSFGDYQQLAYDELFYDKRDFMSLLKDILINSHSVMSLLFKRSLFEPMFIRLTKFVFEINMQFTSCALLFTDSYIEARLKKLDIVKILLI
jgi:hypothetical protein